MYGLTDDCFDAVDFEELDEGDFTNMEVDTRLGPPPIVDFEDETGLSQGPHTCLCLTIHVCLISL